MNGKLIGYIVTLIIFHLLATSFMEYYFGTKQLEMRMWIEHGIDAGIHTLDKGTKI